MSETRPGKAGWITTLIVLIHLLATGIAHLLLVWLVDPQRYGEALWLTLRIIWGCWIVHVLAVILTRVTIFAWKFRRYFRWPGEVPEGPVDATSLPRQGPLRATRAPWVKSAAASFSISVVLVSLTGACAVASVVLWILKGVLGDEIFGLVLGIIWSSWWVLCIATVLTRLVIFRRHMNQAVQNGTGEAVESSAADGPDGNSSDVAGPAGVSSRDPGPTGRDNE